MKYILILLIITLWTCGGPEMNSPPSAKVQLPKQCTALLVGDRCEILANEYEPAHYGLIGEIDCDYDPAMLWFEDDNGSFYWREENETIVCPPLSE